MKLYLISFLFFMLLIASCNSKKNTADASGTFEAVETIISAEANGKILAFNLSEGEVLKPGQSIGYIDSTQLYLSKLQLIQNRKAILSGRPNIKTQIESLKKELANAKEDQKRIENLVKGEVASQKQLDDANTRVAVLESKIEAQQSSLNTSSTALTEQGNTVEVQLAQVNDQLQKCKITNPIQGTVLSKYAEQNEMTSPGKALYKIADLSTIVLRAYISGNQLPQIKLNQKVKVLTDDGKGGFKEIEGVITWINDKAEFTPKTIQTKDERANMVYALKIKVQNNGAYKIGMYGEVKFQ
jgi:HlyD family secretion protein